MPNAATAIFDRFTGALAGVRRRPDRFARGLGELGIAVALLVTPFLLGGRHDASRFVYVVGASLAALGMLSHAALARRIATVPAWVLALLAGATGLLFVQVVPLPSTLLATLSSSLGRLLPLWGDGAPFGPWRTLSVTPAETREALGLVLAHGMLAIALFLRVRDMEDIERLLRGLSVAAIVMALLGFLQYAFGDGSLLGLYDHPRREFTRVQGAFANKNHFAHFILLGLGPTLWLAFRNHAAAEHQRLFRRLNVARIGRSSAWVAAIALLVVGVLASQSRGGVASLGVAAIIATGLLFRAGMLKLPQVTAAIVAALAVLSGVSWMGYERIAGRVDDLFSGELDTLDSGQARRAIWKANADAFSASPWFGFGAGSHREVYPAFIEEGFNREFTHAESGYLQVASESGVVGLLLLAGAVGAVGATVVRGVSRAGTPDAQLMWVAVVPGLVCSLVHSAVDFVWYLPGLLAPTIALAVVAVRLAEDRNGATPTVRVRSDVARFLPVGLASAAASVAISVAYGPAMASTDWDRVQRAAVARRGMTLRLMREEPERADPLLASTIRATGDRMAELLEAVLRADPSSAAAHQQLATRYLERFEASLREEANGMTLDLVADTARRGGFRSRAEMLAWLDRAYGENAQALRDAAHHAERAIRLSPMQGEAYLHLASVAFLLDQGPQALALTDQALAIRPQDGDVLFEAGRRHWLAGDNGRSITCWRRSIRQPGSHVAKLVAHFARIAPAAAFVASLEPNGFAVYYALAQYAACGDEADMLALSRHSVAEAERMEAAGEESPHALARHWWRASFSLRSLDKAEEAIRAAERAVALAPYDYSMRHELAVCLRMAERFDDADTHIRWCLARRPDLRHLRVWLEESAKRRTLVDRNRRRRHVLFDSMASRATDPAREASAAAGEATKPLTRSGVHR